MDGDIQDNCSIAVTPGTRTNEVFSWLEGACDEYGILMDIPERVVPAGVGLHLEKKGFLVRGFHRSDIKPRNPELK